MKEPFYHNLQMKPDAACFLYVGEIKALGLNRHLERAVGRHYGQESTLVAIVPDVLACYPEGNLVVVNAAASRARSAGEGLINRRMATAEFYRQVSDSPFVRSMVSAILERQDRLYVNVFESRPELTLVDGDKVRVVGPEAHLALTINSKIFQYELARRMGIPVPPGGVGEDLEGAVDLATEILGRGSCVFVSGEYSAAGSNSVIAATADQVRGRFRGVEGRFLATAYVPHRHDPTVLGVVAGPEEIYIASVADQRIEGTRFKGSTYPTVLPGKLAAELIGMTRSIGMELGRMGYRGAFGCDYVVTPDGRPIFIEINARKQGTTMETTLTMLRHLPGQPTFPEIEWCAVVQGRLPEGLREMDPAAGGLAWGTYNVKVERDFTVASGLPVEMSEEELFQRAASGRGGVIVADHVGEGTRICEGSFLARVIAAAPELSEIEGLLEEGKSRVRESVAVK